MKRREFIAGLVGAAALPFSVRAQDRERVRRVAVFNSLPADDPEAQARQAAFLQGLQEFGGESDGTCGSIPGGARVMPIVSARLRPSWPRSLPMSSSARAA